MKKAIKKFSLVIILLISYFSSLSAYSAQASTIYVMEESAATPDLLTIHVTRNTRSSTQLILNTASTGIPKQVQNIVCDNQPIAENKPGVWLIPTNCHMLQWQVPLLKSGTELASVQQSMKDNDYILFSEASSLPRLQDATSEIIKISIPNTKTIFPTPNFQNEVYLPAPHSAPLFLLLNATIAGTAVTDSIRLTYLLDNPTAISKLPTLSSHMAGLKWLNTIIPAKTKKDFTVGWLGVSAKNMSLAGAAGSNILLANYPNDGESLFGQAMLLYVTLHEAFHQLALHYPDQPAWVSESLASYYGMRSLQVALPNDPNTSALLQRFLKGSEHFQKGLVAINRNVKNGDRSEYGAFYTKGIAFWMAVDQALKKTQNDSLDKRLLAVLQMKCNADGEPIDLQKRLHFSIDTWSTLRHNYLE